MAKQELGWFLKNRRKTYLKLTQKEVAEQFNVVQSTISGIESGRHALSVEDIALICEIYNVTPAEIIAIADYRSDVTKEETKEKFLNNPDYTNLIFAEITVKEFKNQLRRINYYFNKMTEADRKLTDVEKLSYELIACIFREMQGR